MKKIILDIAISADAVAFRQWLDRNVTIDEPIIVYTYHKYLLENKSGPVVEELRQRIEHNLAFLKNTSIWVRTLDVSEALTDVENEFNWFKNLGLYDFDAAKEFIEYQVRAQKENYLDPTINGGHSTHVSPMVYSNEVNFRDFFFGGESTINFKFMENKVGNFKSNNVSLRILLIDDKIGENCVGEQDLDCDCSDCKGKGYSDKQRCKLWVLKQLMSGKFISAEEKKENFIERTYWNDNINTYLVKELKIKDLWGWNDEKKELERKACDKIKPLDTPIKDGGVQIVGVCDLNSALALMSCCKFDIILLDYLLGERTNDKTSRSYSTELFEFLSYEFEGKKNNIDNAPEIVQMLAEDLPGGENIKLPFLEKFREEVKLNRGPLDKYWIIPMTSYNYSFISDLQRKHVRLIDYRWNISQGADPINTPWKFLHKINEFVDLQLRGSVFTAKQLLTFLRYTGEELKEHIIKKEEKTEEKDSVTVDFKEFQFFMGSEYASFMRHYGNMRLIQYDAVTADTDTKTNDDETCNTLSNKSLFSTYVWQNFYNKDEFLPLLGLNRKMRNFYYIAAFMPNDHNGRKRLREAFYELRLTIDLENLVQVTTGVNRECFEAAINNISNTINTFDGNK